MADIPRWLELAGVKLLREAEEPKDEVEDEVEKVDVEVDDDDIAPDTTDLEAEGYLDDVGTGEEDEPDMSGMKTSALSGTELFKLLFGTRDQIHYWHLQTASYSEHVALNELYDSLLASADAIMEGFHGAYESKLVGAVTIELKDYQGNKDVASYLKEFKETFNTFREQFSTDQKPNLVNLSDDVIQQIDKTVYLLTLK